MPHERSRDLRARRAARPDRRPALVARRYLEYIDTKTALLLLIGIGGFIGYIGMAGRSASSPWPRAARMPPLRKIMVYVPIVGGVVLGVGVLLSRSARSGLTSDFLDGPRTVDAAVGANAFLLARTRCSCSARSCSRSG